MHIEISIYWDNIEATLKTAKAVEARLKLTTMYDSNCTSCI